MSTQTKAPQNPEVVHLNGRILLKACQRNTYGCFVLSALIIVIALACFEYGKITILGLVLGLLIPLFCIGVFLNYLLKLCFIDGAMNALIIRGNKGQPVNL